MTKPFSTVGFCNTVLIALHALQYFFVVCSIGLIVSKYIAFIPIILYYTEVQAHHNPFALMRCPFRYQDDLPSHCFQDPILYGKWQLRGPFADTKDTFSVCGLGGPMTYHTQLSNCNCPVS